MTKPIQTTARKVRKMQHELGANKILVYCCA